MPPGRPSAPAARSPPPQADDGGAQAQRPGWRWLKRLLLAAFLGGVAWLLWRGAQGMNWPQVLASVRSYPAPTLAGAALLAAASHALYGSFDLLGRHYTGHRLAPRQVLTVAFISYAFNLNLGALVGGVAFRLRLYARLGLPVDTITRVIGLSMVTNWLGYLLLAGVLFLAHPLPLPPQWGMDLPGLQLLGLALLAVGAAYLALCAWSPRRHWQLRGQAIELPAARLARLQAGLGLGNWLLLGSLLHVLMPTGLDFASVLLVLLLAAVAGVITHVPAGLGVLEAVFLVMLSHRAPRHELLAALLTYRMLYYLAPLALAMVLYGLTEARAGRARKPAKAPPPA